MTANNGVLSQSQLDALTPRNTGWHVNPTGKLVDFVVGQLSGERSEWYYAKLGPWIPVTVDDEPLDLMIQNAKIAAYYRACQDIAELLAGASLTLQMPDNPFSPKG